MTDTSRVLSIWLQVRNRLSRAAFFASVVGAIFVVLLPAEDIRAEVAAVGDVVPLDDPDLPIDGGVITDVIQVGINGVGRMTIDGRDSLTSGGGIIGVNGGGIGEVEVSGFTTEWIVNVDDGMTQTQFTVGASGYGTLNLVGGAKLEVVKDDEMTSTSDGDILIAESFNSYGEVQVQGFGSLLEGGELVVAEFGMGVLDVFNRGTVRTTSASLGSMNGAVGTAKFSGQGTRWLNEGDLEIGTDTGTTDNDNGHGILEISSDAIVSIGVLASNGEEFDDGETNINELGRVDLAGGRLLTYDLNNAGLIRGDGWLQASNSFEIASEGEIRNAALTANLREYLYVADSNVTVNNAGIIESLGGEMEFEGPVGNQGAIIARSAVMRFQSGLTNSGGLTVGGETTIYGNITNTGEFLVLPEDTTLLIGDFVTSGLVSMAIDPFNASHLAVEGMVTLAGEIEVSFLNDFTISPGESYELIYATDGITNTFATETLPDIPGISLMLDYQPNRVVLTTLQLEFLQADFNKDGDVDGGTSPGNDLGAWKLGYGTGTTKEEGDADGDGDVDGFDFLIWQRQFGLPQPTAAVSAIAAASQVPEPGSLVLALSATLLCCRRRAA